MPPLPNILGPYRLRWPTNAFTACSRPALWEDKCTVLRHCRWLVAITRECQDQSGHASVDGPRVCGLDQKCTAWTHMIPPPSRLDVGGTISSYCPPPSSVLSVSLTPHEPIYLSRLPMITCCSDSANSMPNTISTAPIVAYLIMSYLSVKHFIKQAYAQISETFPVPPTERLLCDLGRKCRRMCVHTWGRRSIEIARHGHDTTPARQWPTGFEIPEGCMHSHRDPVMSCHRKGSGSI